MSIIDGHRSTGQLVAMWLSDVASGYLAKWTSGKVAGNWAARGPSGYSLPAPANMRLMTLEEPGGGRDRCCDNTQGEPAQSV